VSRPRQSAHEDAANLARLRARDPERWARAALEALGPETTHVQLVQHLAEERIECPLELYERLYRRLWPGRVRLPAPGPPAVDSAAPVPNGRPPVTGPKPDSHVAALVSVARTLPQPFGYALLVLRCWERHPAFFGLAGFEKFHPCSHRVSGCLYSKTGPLKRGLLRRVGAGGFVVAQEGA
jgi:hypothetical protein